ncbi:putative transporter SVOPL [Ochlerotatus camptorhynchus]|uniref:putative transporter SVOPL n=1 Tax=Ochlerotatus camptorhynchus TaxID=644619 RepID=UPI0031D1E909
MEIVERKGSVGKSSSLTMEDALAMAKFGIFNVVLIIVSGTILASFLLEILGVSYIIPVIGQDLDVSTKEKGVLSAVGFAGVIVSSHLWGFLADTYGRRKIIIPALLITFVISTVSSFTANFWVIVFLRFMVGFFISGPSSATYAYLGEFHSRKNASRAIMGASVVFGTGGILLPGLAYIVINQGWELPLPFLGIIYRPWRLYLIVCSLPGLICALILLKFPETPKFTFNQGDTKQAIEAIQWVYRFNSLCRKSVPLVIESIQEDADDQQEREKRDALRNTKGCLALMQLVWNQTAPLFMSQHLQKTVIVCILQFGTYLAAHGMFMFFPEIVNQLVIVRDSGVSRATMCEVIYQYGNFSAVKEDQQGNLMLEPAAFQLSFVLELIYAVGFAVIGMIINAVGRLPILVFVFVTCGVAGLLLFVVDIPIAVIWLYIVFLCSGYTAVVVNAIIVDLYPTSLRAMAVCIALMVGRLGSVVGSNMLGILLERHCELTFGIASVLLIICGLLTFFIPNIRQSVQTKTT